MPVAVLSQDWGGQLGFNATDLWRAWAPNLHYQPTVAGHYMAEEAPEEVTGFITDLAARHR